MPVILYKSKTPVAIFSLPVVVALACAGILWNAPDEPVCFFNWQMELMHDIQGITWLNYSLSVLIISVNAHQINNVFNRNSFFTRDTFLPGFIYVCGLISFNALAFSPALLAHLALIGALAFLFQIKRQDSAKVQTFASGLLIGIGLIFNPLLALWVIIPWITLGIIRPFSWREWLIALLGMALPSFYHVCIHFVVTGFWGIQTASFKLIESEFDPSILEQVSYGFSILLLLIGSLGFIGVMRSQVVSFKKISQIILTILLLSLISSIVSWLMFNRFDCSFYLPASVVLSVYLLNTRFGFLMDLLTILWLIAGLLMIFFG